MTLDLQLNFLSTTIFNIKRMEYDSKYDHFYISCTSSVTNMIVILCRAHKSKTNYQPAAGKKVSAS